MVHSFVYLALISSTLADVEVSDLAVSAEWIGRIKITSIESTNTGEFPMSSISASITEVIKGEGSKSEVIHFEMPGGARGQKKYMVLGVPPLRVSNEYIVFLTKDPRVNSSVDAAALTGWAVFKIFENKAGTQVMRSGDSTMAQAVSQGYALTHDRRVKDYDTFVAEIFRALN